MARLYHQLLCTTLLAALFLASVQGHIQDVSRSAIYSDEARETRTDYFTFQNPYLIGGNGWDQAAANPVEDARFVHDYLEAGKHSVYKFEITNNKGIVVAMPWVAACKSYEDSYIHTALLGPLSDPRFETPTAQFKADNNINWEIPAGYGAIFALHPPVDKSRGQVRPTLNITLPEGEFPNAWFVPHNNGNQDPTNLAFQKFKNDTSVGVLGCAMPPERCPGSPFPFNQTSPFCPHYKVGDYCGPKPWKWIKEREVQNGVYYIVFWEAQGNPVDYAAFIGYEEQLRMGRLNTTACAAYDPAKVPPSCQCGSKSQLVLPEGCLPLFPASRARTHIVYNLVNQGAVLHTKCNWVNNNPIPGVPPPDYDPTTPPAPACNVKISQRSNNYWTEGSRTVYQTFYDLVNSGSTNANPIQLTLSSADASRIKNTYGLVRVANRSDGTAVFELPDYQTKWNGGVPANGKYTFEVHSYDAVAPFKIDFVHC